MSIRLSKSALEKFKACPRCFWLEKNHKIKQPEGIRAGVPMGIDRVLKAHYDGNRNANTVPPEMIGQVPGGLYPGDRISMDDLRNWRKGLSVNVAGCELSTAMDDLLFNPATKLYNVIDAKSKANLTDEADTRKYYEVQADAYDWALNVNGYPTDLDCYFVYYSPMRVAPSMPSTAVPFAWNAQVIKIKADHERIKKLVLAAAACLESALPEPRLKVGKAQGCPVCTYLVDRDELFASLKAGAPA